MNSIMDFGFQHSPCVNQSVGPANQLVTLLVHTLLTTHCAISPPTEWPKDYGDGLTESGLANFDFVVIGGGSAGSVVASRLTENPDFNVLLIEAGGDPPTESEVPNWFFAMQLSPFDWRYKTENDGRTCLGMRDSVCLWPQGRMLGGSSGMNGMLYIPGNRKDYDDWKAFGNPTWGYDDVKKYFAKTGAEPGKRPELIVNESLSKNKLGDDIMKAGNEMGYKTVKKYTEGNYLGYSKVPSITKNGRRFSAAKTFLVPAKNRKNLKVIKFAQVKKINFDDTKRANSVTFVYNATGDVREFTVPVKKEVILSAGAIGTPQLLMLSGIGQETHLKKFNIPIVKEVKGVGRNLQNHVVVPLVFKVNKSTAKAITKEFLLDNIYNYLMNRTSFLAHNDILNIVGFMNTTDPNAKYPDISTNHFFYKKQSPDFQFYVTAVGYPEIIGRAILDANLQSDTMIIYVVLTKPESTGKIQLASDNYLHSPKMFANYLEKEIDQEILLKGVKFQSKFIETEAFKKNEVELVQLPLPACKDLDYKTEEYWKCYIRYLSTTIYHLVGTAKMGPVEDVGSVVDWKLKVKGVKGLRVADASIMPTIVSSNTYATTIMIGEKVADFVNKDWGVEHQEL